MKKTLQRLGMVTVGLSLCLWSCKEQDGNVEPNITKSSPTINTVIEDGRMKFKDMKDFSNFMKKTEKMSLKELSAMGKNSTFTSYLEAMTGKDSTLQKNSRKAKPDESEPIEICDPYFSSVLNENKELELGDNVIYRAGHDYCFFYQNGQSKLIDEFYEQQKVSPIDVKDGSTYIFKDNLIVFNTIMKKPKSSKSARVSGRGGDWFQDWVDDEAYWDSSHKMYAQIWEGNWGVYASSGIKTEANEYGSCWLFWHCWNSLDAQEISVDCSAYMRRYNPSLYGYTYLVINIPEIKEYNCNRAINRFDWSTASIGWNSGGSSVNLGSLKIDLKGFTVSDLSGNAFELVAVTSHHKAKWNNTEIEKYLRWD